MKAIPQHTLKFIDSWLELRSKWAEIAGFVVAIEKDGKPIFEKAYGYANIETKEKMTPDHVFRVASHSKTFTATALMQLQERGVLHIDDTVVQHIEWLKEHSDKRWNNVTLRQLMSHSAGVIRDGLDSSYWQLLQNFPDADTLKAEILKADLVIEPNTRMKYSNYGYSLLGLVVEAASGQSYEDYLKEHIISPLGLESTSPDYDKDLKNSAPHSRMTLNKKHLIFPNQATHAMASATGVSSNARDLIKYFSAHMIGSGKLLSDDSKKEMQREQWPVEGTHINVAYGLGFEHSRFGGRKLVGHGGGFPGFSTVSLFDANDKLVITVLTNTNNSPNEIIGGILEVIDALGEQEPEKDLQKFEVRFSDIWGAYEIVATQWGLRGIWPNGWKPFSDPDELKKISDTELKITKTDGFSGQGELLVYTFNDDGTIHHLIEGGAYRVPNSDADVPTSWIK